MQPAQRGGGEPNGWYPNQQYPQQYQTRQFPNQYANGNRYNGPNGQYPQASHDPYFHYHQQQHYIPPNFPPQMGGPGPNTMQNGYMGPGGYSDYPPYMRAQGGPQQPIHAHAQQQVPYPTPPPSDPQPQPPASQSSFAEDSDVTASSHAEAPPYQQQPPPPSIPPSGPHLGHDSSHSGGFVSGGPNGYNGMPHNPIPQMQYPYYPPNGYPPNHPYAYGGGVGYPQYGGPAGYQQFVQHGQVPGQYVSGHGPSPSHTRENTGSSSTNSVKGLNPAAAGFTFTPSSQRQRDAQVNGETSDAAPVFASIQQPASRPRVPEPSGQVDNPGVEPKKFNLPAMPAIVNGDKFKGVQAEAAPVDSGSLGLSQMDVQAEPSEKPAETSSIALSNGDEASATQSAVEAKQEEAKVVEEPGPAAPTEPAKEQVEPSTSTETPVEKASSVKSPIANKWNFVGPTVSGYSSPLPSGTNGRAGAAVPETKSPKGSKKAQSVPEGPIHLRSTRPEINSVDGNVYSLSLSQGIPKSVKVVKGDEGEKSSRTPRTRERGNARRAVLAIGDDVALSKIKTHQRSSGLVFGSADAQEIATPEPEPVKQEVEPEPTPQVEVPVPEAEVPEVPEIAEEVQPPVPEVQTQAPKPRAPPSSWAALLRPATTASSSAVATKASSPAPTVASAGTSGVFSPEASEAGPSRRPTSPLSEGPTTPKAPKAQLPSAPSSVSAKAPPPSTGAASSKAPRPVFNYAAAAAAGANLSPQEELAKLLIDGVPIGKGKAKEGTLTLPRGLINTGNMCFANTILQVLVYCSPFTELFEELGKRLKADLARKTPLLEAMIIFLREFASTPGQAPPSGTSTPKTDGNRRDARREAFVPENVYDAMKENKRFDSMRRGFQEDAEEYLGFFLDTLHEEILYILSRTQTSRVTAKSAPAANGDSEERSIARPTSPNANGDGGDGWLEVGKKQKTNVVRNTETKESAVSKLFGGSIRSVLHTPGSKDSVTLEPYQPLQLDIQSSDVTSITDALRHLNQPETVPGVWSASRGQNVDATKQVFIETFPRVLILHLKRFVYDAEERSVVKRSKPVAYGTELIVPPEIITPARRAASPVKYKLFGVVYHHGASASGGHYTVSVAKQDATGWIHFDDETVSTVPTEQVVVSPEEAKEGREGRGILVGGRERCAYLLFYQRVRA